MALRQPPTASERLWVGGVAGTGVGVAPRVGCRIHRRRVGGRFGRAVGLGRVGRALVRAGRGWGGCGLRAAISVRQGSGGFRLAIGGAFSRRRVERGVGGGRIGRDFWGEFHEKSGRTRKTRPVRLHAAYRAGVRRWAWAGPSNFRTARRRCWRTTCQASGGPKDNLPV